MNSKEIKVALKLASDALVIAADWNVEDVQIWPPSAWKLTAEGEDTNDGWCSCIELADKLKELAETI